MNITWFDSDFYTLILRLSINLLFLMVVIRYLYYPKAKRKDYLFTYFLIGFMTFFLCFGLKKLDIEKYYKTKVMYLSSGEQKKLELLRLILEQKKLWVLDEPFNHLDDLSIEILNQTFLDHINSEGMILFASHFDPNISNIETIEFN